MSDDLGRKEGFARKGGSKTFDKHGKELTTAKVPTKKKENKSKTDDSANTEE